MTTKIIKRPITPPRDPENRVAIETLSYAVNELTGSIGDTMQRAVRVCELIDSGIASFNADGTLAAKAGTTTTVVGGGGAVSSVFGRTGAVVAASGDYTAAQVGAEPTIAAGTTAQYRRGDKTWQTLDTLAVVENTNLYFTNARAVAAVLTGYALGANSALAATDTVNGAFGKVQAQINAKENTIAAGTTSQYRRGDNSWQTLNTAAVPELTNLYYTDARATAAVLASYALGANSALATTDTVTGAFGKVQAQLNAKQATIAAGTTAQYRRGDNSWQTLDTLAVAENTNLYFTNARAIGAALTGYAVGANSALAATDTINGAFGKVQAQLNAKVSAATTLAGYGITDAQPIRAAGRSITTATDTLVAADANKGFDAAGAAGQQITIPPSVLPAGADMPIVRTVSGTATLKRGTGVTLKIFAGSSVPVDTDVTLAAGTGARLWQYATNAWAVMGDGLSATVTNLFSNPSFVGGTGWSFNGAGNFTGDKANFNGVANNALSPTGSMALVAGQVYTVSWTTSSYVSGSLAVQSMPSGTTTALTGNGNGAWSTTITPVSGDTYIRFLGNAGTPNFSIDDVSCI